MNRTIKRSALKAFFLYLLVVSLFHLPVAFLGRSFLSSLYQPHGMAQGWPYGYKGRVPLNTFNIDLATPAYYEEPVNRFVGHMYRHGELPLWNPYQGAGVPLFIQYSSRVFFPYQIIEDISPPWTWDYFMLLRAVLAGFFTFLFLSELGLSFPASFSGGVIYIFTGTFTSFMSLEQLTNPAMMIPFHLYALERLVKRTGAQTAALASVTVGLILLAGQPETALYVLFLGACYMALRAFTVKGFGGALKSLGAYVSSGLLGASLAAPLIIPFYRFMKESYHIHGPDFGVGVASLEKAWFKGLALFAPVNQDIPQSYRIFPINGVWDLVGGYMGLTPVFLLLTCLFLGASLQRGRPLRGEALFFPLFSIALFLKNFGVAPFLWLGYLPLFDQAWSQRWASPVILFSVAVAGGLCLEMIRHKAEEGEDYGRRLRITVTASFVATVLVYLFFVTQWFHELDMILAGKARANVFIDHTKGYTLWTYLNMLLPVLFTGGAFSLLIFSPGKKRGLWAVTLLVALELWWCMNLGYDTKWQLLKLVPLFFGLMGASFLVIKRWSLALGALFLFVLSFAMIDMGAPSGQPRRYDPFTEPPYVAFLKKRIGHFRVVGGYGVLFPNFASAAGIQDIRFINSLSIPSFHRFKNTYLQKEPYVFHDLWFTGSQMAVKFGGREKRIEEDILKNLRFYSFLGVKYVLLPPRESGKLLLASSIGSAPFTVEYSGPDAVVFRNRRVLPRVFPVRDLLRAGSYEEAQSIIGRRGFDLLRRAVIEEAPPRWYAPSGKDVRQGDEHADITLYRANRVELEASLLNDALLVLTDVFEDGWKAFVDGEPAKTYRVDGLVRGVFLKKGKHRVVFVYRPEGFTAGGVVFLLSLFSLLGISYPAVRRYFRRDHNRGERYKTSQQGPGER